MENSRTELLNAGIGENDKVRNEIGKILQVNEVGKSPVSQSTYLHMDLRDDFLRYDHFLEDMRSSLLHSYQR